jgi:hypothetical protein
MKKKAVLETTKDGGFVSLIVGLFQSKIIQVCLLCLFVYLSIIALMAKHEYLPPRSYTELRLEFLFCLCLIISVSFLRAMIPISWRENRTAIMLDKLLVFVIYTGVVLMLAVCFQELYRSKYSSRFPNSKPDVITRVLGVIFAAGLVIGARYDFRKEFCRKTKLRKYAK